MSTKQVPFNWPVDEKGEAKALITTTVKELIPTAKFANVEISNTVTRFVDDDMSNLTAYIEDTYDQADRALQTKRDEILHDLEEGNK